jgi:hypothetical protein
MEIRLGARGAEGETLPFGEVRKGVQTKATSGVLSLARADV